MTHAPETAEKVNDEVDCAFSRLCEPDMSRETRKGGTNERVSEEVEDRPCFHLGVLRVRGTT